MTSHTIGPDPGVREAWARGRPRYAVWLLRVQDPAVLARARAVAQALGESIVPVPTHELHVTVRAAGFPTAVPRFEDDVPEAVLTEQARRARGQVRLAVGGPVSLGSCAALAVEDPHGELLALRNALELGPPEIRPQPYLPHITIGRYPRREPLAPLLHRMALLDPSPPLPLLAVTLELVELDALVWDGPLHTRWSVPL